jgi:hypothetical protein
VDIGVKTKEKRGGCAQFATGEFKGKAQKNSAAHFAAR